MAIKRGQKLPHPLPTPFQTEEGGGVGVGWERGLHGATLFAWGVPEFRQCPKIMFSNTMSDEMRQYCFAINWVKIPTRQFLPGGIPRFGFGYAEVSRGGVAEAAVCWVSG